MTWDIIPNIVKAITGKTNWLTPPSITLENTANQLITSAPTTSFNLTNGLQVLTVAKAGLVQNFNAQGRSLVNLLGRQGNFEPGYTGNLGTNAATASFDTTSGNYTQGSQSAKLTTTAATGSYGYENFQRKASTYYVGLVDTKMGSGTNVAISLDGYSNTGSAAVTTNTSGFTTIYATYATSATAGTGSFNMLMSGATGSYAWFDGARLYEITQAEYNAINAGTYTYAQIIAKYPYVDDIKHLSGLYVWRYGENLLPQFNEWTLNANSTVTEPYKLTTVATGNDNYTHIIIPAVPNQTYIISATHNGKISMNAEDKSGAYLSGTGYTTAQTATITTPSNTVQLHLFFSNETLGAGTFTFTNPRLNIGAVDKGFKPRNDDTMIFPIQLASSMDGTVYDQIFHRDGRYWRENRFVKDVVIDGGTSWQNVGSYNGFKICYTTANALPPWVTYTEKLIKYDGKILKTATIGGAWAANGADTSETSTDTRLYISIPNADTGWGDTASQSNTFSGTGAQTVFTLTPPANTNVNGPTVTVTVGGVATTAFTLNGNTVTLTTAPASGTNNVVITYLATYMPTIAEIQAYFYGWVMVDSSQWGTTLVPYIGTGSKGWVKRYNGTGTVSALPTSVGQTLSAGAVSTVPNSPATGSGYQPYKITYQLATSTFDDLTETIEGQINLLEGANQIEIGAGMILREKVSPVQSDGTTWRINSRYPSSSELSRRVSKIWNVYKNSKYDNWYNYYTSDGGYTNGLVYAGIPNAKYDPTVTYEVTYQALDQYLLTTSPVTNITGEYDANIKMAQDKLSQRMSDNEQRLSVAEWLMSRIYRKPDMTVENKYIYVDGTNGSDSGDGSSSRPFKTIMKAVSLAPQVINHAYNIYVAPGTYSEDVRISGFVGRGYFRLIGSASALSDSYVCNFIVVSMCGCNIEITGMKTSTTTSGGFFIESSNNVYLNYVKNDAVSTSQVGISVDRSKVYINNYTFSNKNVAIYAHVGAEILAQNGSGGTGNNTAYVASYGGKIAIDTTEVQATTRAAASTGGIVSGYGITNPWGDNTQASRSFISAYGGAPQSYAASAWTKIAYGTKVFDNLSEYDGVAYRFTAKKAGVYLVSAAIGISSPPTGFSATLSVFVNNGRTKDAGYSQTNGTGSTSYQLSAQVKLSAGDYIEIYLFPNGAVSNVPGSAYSYLDITQIA